jgi:general secretion pathway protein D
MPLRSSRHAPCCLLLVASLACAQVTAPPAVSAPPPSKKDAKRAGKLFKSGSKDLAAHKLPKAEEELEQAVQLDPTRIQYKAALDLTRSHMVTNLVRAAEKDRAAGNSDGAAGKLQEAHRLDSENPTVKTLMSAMSQAIFVPKEDPAPVAIVRGVSVTLHPRNVRQSFHSRGLPSQLIRDVLLAYGVTPIIDDSVPRAALRIDLDDATYAETSDALKLLTGTFFVPLDETHVIVAKDSREKHTQFDRVLTEDISLPGTPAAEMNDLTTLLKGLFDLRQVFTSPDRAAISIRGTEAQLDHVNKTIADLVAAKGQVLLEMRLYQINKQRTRNIGVQLPTSESIFNVPSEVQNLVSQNPGLIDQLVSSGLVNPGDTAAIAALLVFFGLAGNSILAQPFGVFGGGLTLTGYTLGQATLNLQMNQSETRELDTIQLRLADQDTATLRSGVRYPIITGNYSGLAASSNLPPALQSLLGTSAGSVNPNIAAAPPQIEYQDLGLTLKATPRVNRDGTVHIKLDFTLLSLTGQASNGIPILTSRQFTSNASTKDGDSVMLVSTLSRQESRALSGIPGVSEIPGAGLETNHQREFDTTDLVLVMTPHIVRKAHTGMSAPMITIGPHS